MLRLVRMMDDMNAATVLQPARRALAVCALCFASFECAVMWLGLAAAADAVAAHYRVSAARVNLVSNLYLILYCVAAPPALFLVDYDSGSGGAPGDEKPSTATDAAAAAPAVAALAAAGALAPAAMRASGGRCGGLLDGGEEGGGVLSGRGGGGRDGGGGGGDGGFGGVRAALLIGSALSVLEAALWLLRPRSFGWQLAGSAVCALAQPLLLSAISPCIAAFVAPRWRARATAAATVANTLGAAGTFLATTPLLRLAGGDGVGGAGVVALLWAHLALVAAGAALAVAAFAAPLVAPPSPRPPPPPPPSPTSPPPASSVPSWAASAARAARAHARASAALLRDDARFRALLGAFAVQQGAFFAWQARSRSFSRELVLNSLS